MKNIGKGLRLTFISFFIIVLPGSTQLQKSSLPSSKAVAFPAQITVKEETFLNTVTTIGTDGSRYKLVQIGDRLPKLYVNNKLILTKDLDQYAYLINRLTPILWKRQKVAGEQNEANAIRWQDFIVNDLISDKVIKTPKDLLSFRLTVNELVINGKVQSFAIFSRYVKKYVKGDDMVYQFNYSSKK